MSAFDVEKEAERFVIDWISGLCSERSPEAAALQVLLHRAIEATREEVEEECIKDCCRYCERGLPLVRDPHLGLRGENTNPPEFWYQHTKDEDPDFKVYCGSANIHERRRKREELT